MVEGPSSSGDASSINKDNDYDSSFSDGSSDGENHNPNFGNVVPQETVQVVLLLIKSQPLKKAIQKVWTKNRTPEEMDGYKMEMEEYIQNLFDLPFCFSLYRWCFTPLVVFTCIGRIVYFLQLQLGLVSFFFSFFPIKLTYLLSVFCGLPTDCS
jgi:hypothetical protein